MLEVLEVIRCVLLCMLEAVEGGLSSLEAMHCMLLRMLGVCGCGWSRARTAQSARDMT